MSLPDPFAFGVVVAAVLLPSPVVTGTVAAILIWTSKQAPDVETLRERAEDAITLFLMSLAAATVGVIALLSAIGVTLPGRAGLSLIAYICLLIVLPAIGFLRTWKSYWLPLVMGRRDRIERGIQGIQGVQGEQGVQGVQGIQGVQGPAGLPADRDG